MALSSTLIACDECKKYNTDDLQIVKASVIHDTNINSTIWEINVKGNAGKTTPAPAGQLHGAPVLGMFSPRL